MNQIEKINYQIVGLSETKLDSTTAQHIYKENKNYKMWWGTDDNNIYGTGVALILHNDLAKYVQNVQTCLGRIIYVDLFIKGKIQLRIIQVYMNASLNDKISRDITTSQVIKIVIQAVQKKALIIIMGDFNVDANEYQKCVQLGRKKHWRFDLIAKLDELSFIDAHSAVHEVPENTWTNGVSESRIDYIFISLNLYEAILTAETQKPVLYKSDHKVISVIYKADSIFRHTKLAIARRKQIKTRVYDYHKTNNTAWENYAKETDRLLKSDLLLNNKIDDISTVSNINYVWDKLRDIIKKAAVKCIATRWIVGEKRNTKTKSLTEAIANLKNMNRIKIQFKKLNSAGLEPSNIGWTNVI